MTTRKTRSTRKTSTAGKTTTPRKAATPKTPEVKAPETEAVVEEQAVEQAVEENAASVTEDASQKLNDLLNANEDANDSKEDGKADAPEADAAAPAAADPAPPKEPKKPKMLPGQIDPATAAPAGTDEFDVEIDGPGGEGKIVKRFRKPKDGRWVVSGSARNARMWHVIDLDADDATRVLCTLVWTKWIGGRDDRDPQTKAITCPFCLLRALASGMTTKEEQEAIVKKEIEAKKALQALARKAKADKAAAAKAASTASTASTNSTAAVAAQTVAAPVEEGADEAPAEAA